MDINKNPVYDEDYVTLGYLKEYIGEDNDEESETYSKNFGSQPIPPYHRNDTWTDTNGSLYVCTTERLIGDYNPNDWTLIIDRTPYDNLVNEYGDIIVDGLAAQVYDHKIESFVSDSDPSVNWLTYVDKEQHVYDYWLDGTQAKVYVRNNTNPITYSWKNTTVSDNTWNRNTGHKNIFNTKPTTYDAHDLWLIDETTPVEDIPDYAHVGDWVVTSVSNTEYNKTDWTPNTIDLTFLISEPKVYSRIEIDRRTDVLEDSVNVKLQKTENSILAEVSSTYATQETVTSLDSELGELQDTTTNINTRVGALELSDSQFSTRISNVESTVVDLDDKIQNIADITVSGERTTASLDLDNVNESEPIALNIHPIGNHISYLYPFSTLFPGNATILKKRTLRFYNSRTDEIVYDYELPYDLLYFDTETYDEFILDYDSEICKIIKRVEYNSDGTVYKLAEPDEITITPYPSIPLTTGDYTLSLVGYTAGYIFARLMGSNIYTTQFPTRAEMTSAISETADNINLRVDYIYNNYSTTAQMTSEIDAKADQINLSVSENYVGKPSVIASINLTSETATIDASKININGVITAINNGTTTTINGNKITTGTITADQIATGAITASKVSSDIITTTNFSAQSINANNITSGTINASNVSITNLNADNITAGTLNVNRIPNLSASKITSGTMSANRISGGSISGVSISIGSYFKVSSSGLAELTTSGGFLTTGTTSSPYVSALNIAYGSGGISFRNASSQGSAGSQRGNISLSSADGNLVLTATNYVMCGGSGEGYQIATKTGGYPSTKNLKTNIEKIKYDDIYEDMKNMNIYEYDYKYDGIKEKNKHDFGFIIDELEETNTLSKYILNYDRYGKIKGNKLIAYKKGLDAEDFNPKKDGYNFKYKEWDRDTYFKLSLLMIKSLQNKIEKLEEQL